MNLAPICIFAYNRKEHLKYLLESLVKCKYAKDSIVYLFCDGYKSNIDMQKVLEVRDYIHSFDFNMFFKKAHITFSDSNRGLANSVISGVSKVFEEYDKIIVLEDDLVLSQNALEYFNNCLNYYCDNKKIWSISGYSFYMNSLKNYKNDVFVTYRGCSWGWATWKDRWDRVDFEVKDYKSFKWNLIKRNKFSRGGYDLPFMLDKQMYHKIDSWAVRWCYAQSKLNMLTVYPKHSFVLNKGLDGTGTHSGKNKAFDTNILEYGQINLENVDINNEINVEFKAKYGLNSRISRVKAYIYSILTLFIGVKEDGKVIRLFRNFKNIIKI